MTNDGLAKVVDKVMSSIGTVASESVKRHLEESSFEIGEFSGYSIRDALCDYAKENFKYHERQEFVRHLLENWDSIMAEPEVKSKNAKREELIDGLVAELKKYKNLNHD